MPSYIITSITHGCMLRRVTANILMFGDVLTVYTWVLVVVVRLVSLAFSPGLVVHTY